MASQTTRRVAGAAALFGTFIGLNNLRALFNPSHALSQLNFPASSTPADTHLTEGLIRMFAATRVAYAVPQVAAWWYGAYKVLGLQMVTGVLMAAVDGWVSKKVTGGGEWGHWGAAPIGMGIGLWLLLDE